MVNNITCPRAIFDYIYDNLTAIYRPGTLLSYWVLVGFGTVGLPQTAVRCMGFKNTQSLKRAMLIGVVCCSLVMVGMHTAGVWAGALINIGGQGASGAAGAGSAALPSSDYFIPYIIQKIMPGALGYIFLLAPAAAVMSTADSQLLAASSAVSQDIFKGLIKKNAEEKDVLTVSRVTVFLIALIALFLSLNPNSSIFDLVSFAWSGFGGTFGPLVLLALYWKRTTATGAIAGLLLGGITDVVWHYIPASVNPIFGLYEIVPAFLVCLIVTVVVSLLTKPDNEVIAKYNEYKEMED